VFRTISGRPSSWGTMLPAELLRLPEELANPGRWRGDADQGAGPQPGGGPTGARDLREAAVPGRAGLGRQAGRGGPDDRELTGLAECAAAEAAAI
jgi:hypothetical protein